MNFLLTTILPALLPAVADAIRGGVARITGGAGSRPQNVAEAIQLMQAETAKLEALARLDQLAPNASTWVADLRGSFRYIAVGGIVLVTLGCAVWAPGAAGTLVLLDLTGACMSFIIGERMYLGLRK